MFDSIFSAAFDVLIKILESYRFQIPSGRGRERDEGTGGRETKIEREVGKEGEGERTREGGGETETQREREGRR